MFYFEPSFDWYQCTVFISDVSPDSVPCLGCFCPEDVTFPLDYFEAVERVALAYGGDVDIKSVPAKKRVALCCAALSWFPRLLYYFDEKLGFCKKLLQYSVVWI